ncbi:FIST N-terminal domain-containing protein [Paenibacillus sp. MMS20-IR301]|uniref:FIST signal transduction protein n=1 Tax=Paenibacillus sp. MMS20-IR301 TaxID=2895946 RepID=UPI0028EB4089|nr:FIST N-terminal domain-containing protein [Paenibacillus sp. MMS20-IR301]WNS45978.1 FIST N-terminal domain-containing protein [Paenibacillus sp. MMS20-IR301]
MKYSVGRSAKLDIKEAVAEATAGLSAPKLLLFFADVEHFGQYNEEIKARFGDSILLGSSTFAGFCKDGAYKEGLLVMGIDEGIECYADVLEEADRFPLKYVDRINGCLDKFNNLQDIICFEISAALISCEELVLSTLNSVLEEKGIPLFGGSAGDYGRAERTMISLNGNVYNNACAFVFIKNLGGKIRLYRENIYKPTIHHFTATKVDERNRIVHEYDNRPAARVVAEALNTTLSELPKYLDSYPMGRIIGNEMYITANQMVTADQGMSYHAKVYNNSQMVLLEPDDYKAVIHNTIETVKRDIPQPSLALMVNCLARSMLFEGDGYLNEFAQEMSAALGDYAGFAGYGEQLGQQHFNQTMVLAVFE